MVDLTSLSSEEWGSLLSSTESAIDEFKREIELAKNRKKATTVDISILSEILSSMEALSPTTSLEKTEQGNALMKLNSQDNDIQKSEMYPSTFSEPIYWGTYTDDLIVSTIDKNIMNSKSEMAIVCGEAGFIKRYPKLVDSILTIREKGVRVRIYYQNLPKSLLSKLKESGCEMTQGDDYPRRHFWITDDSFAYCHVHPRREDEFIDDKKRLNELWAEADKLMAGSSKEE